MKLIFIHGAPGVGKLTVAEELSKITGMKVFHNHLSFDFAASFFEPFSKSFNKFREDLILSTLKGLVNEDLKGLIFTYCYTNDDMPFIEKIQDICSREEISISYILLTCDTDENIQRVQNEGRKKFKKLVDVETWKNINNSYNLSECIPNVETKIINNTFLPPVETAKVIVDSL